MTQNDGPGSAEDVTGSPAVPGTNVKAQRITRPDLPTISAEGWQGFSKEQDQQGRRKPHWLGWTVAALLAAVLAGAIVLMLGRGAATKVDETPHGREIAMLIGDEPDGATIVVLASDPALATGVQTGMGRPVSTRHRSFNLQRPDRQPEAVAEDFRADLRCRPPTLLIVVPEPAGRAADSATAVGLQPDQLDILKQEQSFAVWFDAHYARVAAEQLRVFRTRSEQPPLRDCR
jgi:hypothetical protein